MAIDIVAGMRVFSAVVEAGSFAGAADKLDLSRGMATRYVAQLEAHLGVRLLNRTTRKLSLTDEGAVFYERCKALLADMDEAEAEITSRSGQATGQLKVNVPVTFGVLHLAPLWAEFLGRHPQVTLDVTLSDRVVDLVEEGYDLAIRIATLPSSTLVSRRLATTRMVLCASPGYLRERGTPANPSDLAQHSVIAYSYWSTGDEWHFEGPKGHVTVATRPCMHTNSGDTCRAMALADQGVILQPTFIVGEDLASGALVELMPQFRSLELGIYVVYPTRKHVSLKVRALIEFLVGAFEETRFAW